MTNQEKHERRREAALRGARTRTAKQALADATEPVAQTGPDPDPEPTGPTGPTGRQLLERAQAIAREADLWSHAHLRRWPTRPSAWTLEQRREAEGYLAGFLRPDGTPQPTKRRTR